MANIVFQNLLAFAGNGTDVLDPMITSLIDQDLVSFEQNSNDAETILGLKETRALTPDQTFSVMIGAYELDEIQEGEDLPIMETGKGNNKGFRIKMYGNQIGITKLFRKWIESAQTIDGADSSVKQEWGRLASNILALRRGRKKRVNIEVTKLLTLGWINTNAYGPGSPTPYGQPLFSASQPYGGGTSNSGTFQNILGGTGYGTADGALSATNLQGALSVLKSSVRLQNGDRVESPSKFTLFVSRKLAVTARSILNTPGSQAGVYAGTGSNANLINTFSFDGNMVEIMELPYLGETLKNGSVLGTEDYRFLMNAEQGRIAMCFRMISLRDAEVRVYQNDSNANTFVATDMGFAVDHYGAESFIVGSRGTA